MTESQLHEWRGRALRFITQLQGVIVGQELPVRLVVLAVFTRGHVLLEGPVGIGKTTLLRAVACGLGGAYQRVEGSIDLLPADLLYYTHLDIHGKPTVDAGPLLAHGERLATFFFNEINRARPQVHAVLLRAMAERSVNAFNRDHALPHLSVFADRNRVERDETFELPAAAKDRFLFELPMAMPDAKEVLNDLMVNPRYHDPDVLLGEVEAGQLPYQQLNTVAAAIQRQVFCSERLNAYALDLWQATHDPKRYGLKIADVDMAGLVESGASPRGMSYCLRAARTHAWLAGRDHVAPEDVQAVFTVTMRHRIFLAPVYAYRKDELMPVLLDGLLNAVAAP